MTEAIFEEQIDQEVEDLLRELENDKTNREESPLRIDEAPPRRLDERPIKMNASEC
jgi:hypothetical protein